MPNGNESSLLYGFGRMWRRGLAQAPVEERGGAYPVAIRWEPVLTDTPSVDGRR